MKVQFILAACLVAAAFAAPIDNFVDPDCIEEDSVIEEPIADIEAEFGLQEPSLRLDFGAPDSDECADEPVTEAPPADEECVDEPIETTAEPEPETEGCVSEIIETEPAPEPTAAECEEEIVTEAPADDCEAEGDAAEAEPYIPFQIEPAHVLNDEVVLGEENFFPEVEECEE